MQPPHVESSPYTPPGAALGAAVAFNRFRLGMQIAIAALTLAVIAVDVAWSLDPQRYFSYGRPEASPWVYAPGPVVVVCCFLLLEGALLAYALTATRPKAMWARCVIALLALGPLSALSVMTVMHAPSYLHLHLIWVWVLTLVVLGALLVAGGAALLRRVRTPRSPR